MFIKVTWIKLCLASGPFHFISQISGGFPSADKSSVVPKCHTAKTVVFPPWLLDPRGVARGFRESQATVTHRGPKSLPREPDGVFGRHLTALGMGTPCAGLPLSPPPPRWPEPLWGHLPRPQPHPRCHGKLPVASPQRHCGPK